MRTPTLLLVATSLLTTQTLSDYIGPLYPAPTDSSSDGSKITAAWQNLTATFDGYFNSNNKDRGSTLAGTENMTFSLSLFSLHDPAATSFQYHYTAPDIVRAPNGTNKVDGDSIYRMASVSKLFNLFSGMLELRDEEWHRPMSQILPQLKEYSKHNNSGDRVLSPQWDKITPWALANHLAGAPGPVLPGLGDIQLSSFASPDEAVEYGLPLIDINGLGRCFEASLSGELVCSADSFIEDAANQMPFFEPWTNPSYSDGGMIILGLAISEITGKSIDERYSESIFGPLDMNSSYTVPPKDPDVLARGVMVDGFESFTLDLSIAVASGALMSTVNDLNKFGVNILNSTLLPEDITRRWMRPTTIHLACRTQLAHHGRSYVMLIPFLGESRIFTRN